MIFSATGRVALARVSVVVMRRCQGLRPSLDPDFRCRMLRSLTRNQKSVSDSSEQRTGTLLAQARRGSCYLFSARCYPLYRSKDRPLYKARRADGSHSLTTSARRHIKPYSPIVSSLTGGAV